MSSTESVSSAPRYRPYGRLSGGWCMHRPPAAVLQLRKTSWHRGTEGRPPLLASISLFSFFWVRALTICCHGLALHAPFNLSEGRYLDEARETGAGCTPLGGRGREWQAGISWRQGPLSRHQTGHFTPQNPYIP